MTPEVRVKVAAIIKAIPALGEDVAFDLIEALVLTQAKEKAEREAEFQREVWREQKRTRRVSRGLPPDVQKTSNGIPADVPGSPADIQETPAESRPLSGSGSDPDQIRIPDQIPEKTPAAPAAPKVEKQAPHLWALGKFCGAWRERYGAEYKPTHGDKSQLGRLVGTLTRDEVIALPALFAKYVRDPDKLASERRHDLMFFCTQGWVNRLRAVGGKDPPGVPRVKRCGYHEVEGNRKYRAPEAERLPWCHECAEWKHRDAKKQTRESQPTPVGEMWPTEEISK